MARTPQPVGFNDPALLNAADQSTPSVAKTSPPSLNRNGTVSTPGGTVSRGIAPRATNGTTTFNQAVQATSGTEVFIVSSNNNDSNDIVTVYNTDKTISVSAVNQTYNSYNVTNTDAYGNSNVAAFLPTYTGDLGAGSLTVAGTTNLGDLSNIYIGGGTNGQVLSTNGSGALIWSTVSGGGSYGNSDVATFLASFGSNTITTTGNANVGNLNAGTTVTASRLVSNIATGTAPFTVTSTTQVANLNVATAGTAGTVTTNSQPNITSVGTLASLSVTANSNIGNIGTGGLITATGNISGGNLTTGGIVSATGNITGNFFIGNGSQLTGITVSAGTNIINGTSNVNIATSGGNVTASVGGNANIVVVTGTGANISGTLSVSGNSNVGNIGATGVFATTLSATANANVGNIGATDGVFTTIAGSLTTNSQPNVTSVGTLSSLSVSGTSNLGPVSNVTITGGSSGQYLQTDGAGVLSFATISTTSISNGTSNVNIPAVNGNVNISSAGNANVLVITGTGANITGTLSATANANVGNIGATGGIFTTVGGSLTTNSQPNITSVGTLTTLSVSGNATVGNLIGILANGNSNVSIPTSSDNVFINVNGGSSKQWIFDTAGNLRTPGNVDIYGAINFPQQVSSINWSTYNIELSQYGRINTNVDFFANANTIGALYLKGDGSNITNISTPVIANGNSNVNIPTANGNITISSAGNANVLVITGTGANITGTLSATANANVGNIGATSGVFTTVDGSLTTNAQPNITSVGTLTSLSVSGNITGGNIIGPLANGNSNVNIATSAGNVTITTNGSQTWTFGTTGNLTFPDGSIQTTAPVAEFPFSVQSSNFVANAGARYGVNTTGGAVTATLPATPTTGIAIFFADAGGAYSSNNLTINRNGQTIMGSATNLTVSTDNQSVGLFYNGTTWRIYNAG